MISNSKKRTELPKAAEAVRYHYDTGNDFYAAWLDPTMTYSCALWTCTDDLETAQRQKLAWHASALGAKSGDVILDIGCGWGSMMRYLRDQHKVRRVLGLTLAEEQARQIARWREFGLSATVEDWRNHCPSSTYDGIVSIGAFEHFASPSLTATDRLDLYRQFFATCHDWLKPGGALSLQTIIYGSLNKAAFSSFIREQIFPDAELPTYDEILEAASSYFDVFTEMRDGAGYARTCQVWLQRLRQQKAHCGANAERYMRYLRYLKISEASFNRGKIDLLRIGFRRRA
jgi:cyclopropane-fatty-acyl-phospholipid synthase